MQVDDIIAKLTAMPEDVQKEAIAQAFEATKDMVFIPSPGPQFEAYSSEADVILFGGSPGGGKTALEIGLALNCHHRSLVVRKNFVDLGGVLHTLDNVVGAENAAVGGNRPVYRKPEGGVIEFMGLGENIDSKQGNPHDLLCVGRGTPVLMADGGYKAVEDVCAGDFVQTLEGPREVQKTFGPMYKEAVEVRTVDSAQVQSTFHELLTPGGWLSSYAFLPSEFCEPKGCRGLCTSASPFSLTSPAAYLSHVRHIASRVLISAWRRVVHPRAGGGSSAYAACMEQSGLGSGCARCGGSNPLSPPRVLSSVLMQAHRRLLRGMAIATRTLPRYASECGDSDAQKTSLLQGCLDRYSGDFRPCGERILESLDRNAERGHARLYLHQPDGVARSNPTDLPQGAQEETPTRNHHRLRYAHPYTKGERQANECVLTDSAWLSPVGIKELYDLQVSEVNHYITKGGFVNRNCIDEAAQVPEYQVRMLMGWLRTDKPGQRCRMVLGSNPPLNSTGDWLITYFAPWLDPQHPRPAQEGELRYFLPDPEGGEDKECEKDDFVMLHGVRVPAQSRTFISSKFTDNPYYDKEQYAKSLAGLPSEAREILVSGNFLTTRSDDAFQTIPTAWIREAQARWTPTIPVGIPLCAIGADVAQGGNDRSVLAKRHDGYYPKLEVKPGKETPDGKTYGGWVIANRRDGAKVIIDIGGGWGGDAYAHLRENGVNAVGYMGVKTTMAKTVDNMLGFANVRSMAYWRFREALDPSQPGGSTIALPPDAEMVADLCAPTYEVISSGKKGAIIKVEPKEDVCDRLKRSTDKGDAVVMAWTDGMKQANIQGGWHAHKPKPQVVMRRGR